MAHQVKTNDRKFHQFLELSRFTVHIPVPSVLGLLGTLKLKKHRFLVLKKLHNISMNVFLLI